MEPTYTTFHGTIKYNSYQRTRYAPATNMLPWKTVWAPKNTEYKSNQSC